MNIKFLIASLSTSLFFACSESSSPSSSNSVAASYFENKVLEGCVFYTGDKVEEYKKLASANVDNIDFTVSFSASCPESNLYGKCKFTTKGEPLPGSNIVEYRYKKPTFDSTALAQRIAEGKSDCDANAGVWTEYK